MIHTGDSTNKGTKEEILEFNKQLGRLPHKYKVVMSGNHDKYLDTISKEEVKKLFTNATHYLQDDLIEIEGIKIYGCPWMDNIRGDAFCTSTGNEYLKIPEDVDILMTHQPPFNILDLAWSKRYTSKDVCQVCNESHQYYGHWGSTTLKNQVLKKVKPIVHIFGHVHDDYGTMVKEGTCFINTAMHWDPDMRLSKYFDFKVISDEDKKEYNKIRKELYTSKNLYILSKMNGMSLTFDKDGFLCVGKFDKKNDNQKWEFHNGCLRLVSKDKYITNTKEGLLLESFKGDETQKLKFESGRIMTEKNLVLDIDRGLNQEGAEVILWKNLDALNQKWELVYE